MKQEICTFIILFSSLFALLIVFFFSIAFGFKYYFT